MPTKKIVIMAADGAPAMKGAVHGLVDLSNADKTFPAFVPVHCIIHREHLAAKFFKYEHVMVIVLKVVNYSRSSASSLSL